MDEELFAHIGHEQRRKESYLKQRVADKLYKIRTQLIWGKTLSGRVLRQQELTSLRAQEVELVKKLAAARQAESVRANMQTAKALVDAEIAAERVAKAVHADDQPPALSPPIAVQ